MGNYTGEDLGGEGETRRANKTKLHETALSKRKNSLTAYNHLNIMTGCVTNHALIFDSQHPHNRDLLIYKNMR